MNVSTFIKQSAEVMVAQYSNKNLQNLLYTRLTINYKHVVWENFIVVKFLETLISVMPTARLLCRLVQYHENLYSGCSNTKMSRQALVTTLLTRRPLNVACLNQPDIHVLSKFLPIQMLSVVAGEMFKPNSFWEWLFHCIENCMTGRISNENLLERLLLVSGLLESSLPSQVCLDTAILSVPLNFKLCPLVASCLKARKFSFIGDLYCCITNSDHRHLFTARHDSKTMAVLEYLGSVEDLVANDIHRVKVIILPCSENHLVRGRNLLSMMNLPECNFKLLHEFGFHEMTHTYARPFGKPHSVGVNLNLPPNQASRNVILLPEINVPYRQTAPVLLPIDVNTLTDLKSTTKLTSLQERAINEIQKKIRYDVRRYIGVPIVSLDNKQVYMIDPNQSGPSKYSREAYERSKVFGALLALDTGSGKTLITILTTMVYLQNNPNKIVLMAVPDTLIQQWKSEIQKHTNWSIDNEYIAVSNIQQLKHYTTLAHVSGPNFKPKVCLASMNAIRSTVFKELMNSLASKVQTGPEPRVWCGGMISIDEVHKLKSKTTGFQRILEHDFDFTLAITATAYQNPLTVYRLMRLDRVARFSNDVMEMVEIYGTSTHERNVKIEQNAILVEPSPWTRQAHALLADVGLLKTQTLHARARKIMRIYERICSGGTVDSELLLAVLKRLLTPVTNLYSNIPTLTLIEKPVDQKTFTEAFDECTICLCSFDNPVQFGCGHVYCYECAQSLLQVSSRKCPICRTDIVDLNVFKPSWATNKRKAGEMVEPETLESKVDTVITGKIAYKDLLLGNPPDSLETVAVVVLDEKLLAFQKYLDTYCRNRTHAWRLVIFSKRNSQAYLDLLVNRYKLKVVLAGALKTRRPQSCENIETFRKGEADVLLLNYMYCEGFDLVNASHTLICDFDITLSKLVQATGRSKRIGQEHEKVYIDTLVMKDSFDQFLYEQINCGEGKLTQKNINRLEWITTRHLPETRMGKINLLTNRMLGRELLLSEINFQNVFTWNIVIEKINSGPVIIQRFSITHAGRVLHQNKKHIRVEHLLGMSNTDFEHSPIVRNVLKTVFT
jgi:superfamily II DNA or RNA helicase